MRAKTLEGVQEQNCRSHYSFRPLHLLSPFPSTQAHSFQPKTNSSPSWPTSHLHFRGPNQSPMQQPIFFFFFSFSFLFFPPLAHHFPLSSPMLPASSYSHPTSCNQPPFFSHATSLFLQPPYLLQSTPFSLLSHHFPLSSPMQTPITPLAHHFPFFPLLVSCMNSPLNTLPTCKPAA